MQSISSVLVTGGNGFLGSAICKAAVGRGWKVTSISRSGEAYKTSKGHTPSWANEVNWHAGDASKPESFQALLDSCDAVVHTLGILLETDYKSSPASLLKGIFTNRFVTQNPLATPSTGKYEAVNTESALSVLQAFMNSKSVIWHCKSPFVYISAEDVFRPVVPSRYIHTKREAENRITEIAYGHSEADQRSIRPIFMRPGLMYHPHTRPLSTLPAALLELSSVIQSKLPSILQAQTAASLVPGISAAQSTARLLSIPPLHIDTVAEAVCRALEGDIEGIVDTQAMRDLVKWEERKINDKMESQVM